MMLTVGNWFVHIPAAVILNFPWAPYFAIGIFMYLFVSEGWRGDMLMLLTSGAIAGVQTFVYQRPFGGSTVPFCLNAAFVMEVGAALLFILQGCRLSHGMQRVAIVMGAMSYPLYLIHDVLGTVVMTTLYGISPGLTFLGVILVLVIAYAISKAEVRPSRWMRLDVVSVYEKFVGGSRLRNS